MGKSMTRLLGLAVLLAFGWSRAGGTFEGEVDMKMTRSGSDKSVITHYFIKGNKMRFEVEDPSGKAMGAGIMDLQTKQFIILLEKQKMYMTQESQPGKFKYGEEHHFKITNTGKSETILGYHCEEWDYTSDNSNGKVWLAEGLGNWWGSEMAAQANKLPDDQKALASVVISKKLFPMKWESDDKSGNAKGTGEVIKVDKKTLSSTLFEVPSDYKKMDLGNLLGGNNSSAGSGNTSGSSNPLDAVKKKLPF